MATYRSDEAGAEDTEPARATEDRATIDSTAGPSERVPTAERSALTATESPGGRLSRIAAESSGYGGDQVGMGLQTTRETREAVAALLRIGEPGDQLLASVVSELGPRTVIETIRAVADLQCSPAEAVAEIAAAGESFPAGTQLEDSLQRWAVRVDTVDGNREIDKAALLGGRLLVPGDEEWPVQLADLGLSAPLGLWVRGPAHLGRTLDRSVAVVGSRAASNYGTKCASDLAWDLARQGVTVVSGGAFGIDGAAHRAALAAEGTTIAFMAGGIDRFYPASHHALFDEMLRGGAIVSETAPGMTPMRHRFLLRNRLIAATARATVIVEAGARSGALNTARHAGEIGRLVAAFPGPVHSATSTGCHGLIKDHAAELITGSRDLLELIADDQSVLFDWPETDDRHRRVQSTRHDTERSHAADNDAERSHAARDDARQNCAARENEHAQESRRWSDQRTSTTHMRRARTKEQLSEAEQICLNTLSATKALDVGTITARAGMIVPETLGALAALELAGLAARTDTGWMKLREREARH